MKIFPAFALVLGTVIFLSGCATTTYREAPMVAAPVALSLAQIKEMTARGVSDATILTALRASRTVYKLTSKDVLDLQEAKVSPAIIDCLLSTPQSYPPQPTPRYRTSYYYYPPPWPYGYPYWGWHDWHFDFHHDFHHSGHH